MPPGAIALKFKRLSRSGDEDCNRLKDRHRLKLFFSRHVCRGFNEHDSFSSLSLRKKHHFVSIEIDSEAVFCKDSVCVCVCRVVGPAVTFKVSPNTQNVSTADVANVAGRCNFG